jgi:hypothetical protein
MGQRESTGGSSNASGLANGDSTRRAPGRPIGILRRLFSAGVATAISLAFLATGAASPLQNVVDRPPFMGATVGQSAHAHVSSSSCAATQVLVPPTVSPSSGRFVTDIAAQANSTTGGCNAQLWTLSTLLGPNFTTTGGLHRVTERWIVTWAWSRPPGFTYGTANISMFANVLDNTTGTWVIGGNSSVPVTFPVFVSSRQGCGNAGCAAGGSNRSVIIQYNVTLRAGDSYRFYSGLFAQVSAHGISRCNPWNHHCSGGSGRSVIDLGSPGHGAWLISLKVG